MEEEIKTKVCTKCGEEKPETTEYFHRNKSCRAGLSSICKECRNKAVRRWRSENTEKEREKAREAVKRWRAKNPEKAREKARENDRRWKAKNPEKVRETYRRWRAENLEKERERGRRWYAENLEKEMEAGRRYRNELAPCYLKSLISAKYDIDRSEIGDELINAKRREIKYYRQLKQLKK